jgi:cell division control protein 7
MAAQVRSRRAEPFRIHEDVPSTEDTQVNEDVMEMDDDDDDDDEYMNRQNKEEDQQSELSDSSEDEAIDTNVQIDMEKLQNCFPGFKHKYRLIKRIGEGMHHIERQFGQHVVLTGVQGHSRPSIKPKT